jgi:helicase
MKVAELIRHEIPPEIIKLWQERESEVLLPLQELAVKKHDLFGSNNLLIQAPTSSGKTFVGEMAALHTALRRKKVVYLVPLKALAEEKYLDFAEKYTPYGLRVIISTRDHRDFDRDLEMGDFSIAVVVYEKLAQLLVRRPERLEEIELVIADELEILSDPERGGLVELLLTRVLRSRCRLIGLSAVIGDAERLARWLEAGLLFYERRPIELRYGVVHEGVFHYRTHNDATEGEERLVTSAGESPWEVMCDTLAHLVEQGENALVFVKARHESRRGAELLAQRLGGGAAAEKALEALRRLEPTRSRDSLIETLSEGVAFHNADLSPDERRIVETAFRTGEARVLVTTSTLATGMNLPVQNVFLSSDKWRYDSRFGMPWKTPIMRSEFENMSGRAGRYGGGAAFGRAMLVANTPFDLETLWRRYIEGEREEIEPQMARAALEDWVLHLVASRCCRTESTLQEFLEATLTGHWVWQQSLTAEEMAFRVRAAVNRCVDTGVLAREGEAGLEVTPFGQAIASKGLTIATGRELAHWLAESEMRTWAPIDLMLAVAVSPDGRMVQVSLTAREYEQADYPSRLKVRTRDEELNADVALNRFRNCSAQPFFEEVRAIKTALFLSDWIEHVSMQDIEENYQTMSGQVLGAADQVSWLIDATAAVAVAVGAHEDVVERIQRLAQRVQLGLREDTLPIGWLHKRGVPRNLIAVLAGQGYNNPATTAAVPLERLTRWLSRADARALKRWAEHAAPALATVSEAVAPYGVAPVLLIDDRHPGSITLDGLDVPLQDKQYRLIKVLAARAGECVSYDDIYTSLWGDSVVENNQVHFQKRKLLDRIKECCPTRATIIKTIPKRGFALCLEPDQVDLRVPAAVNAA